jgi:hypothetical protein
VPRGCRAEHVPGKFACTKTRSQDAVLAELSVSAIRFPGDAPLHFYELGVQVNCFQGAANWSEQAALRRVSVLHIADPYGHLLDDSAQFIKGVFMLEVI